MNKKKVKISFSNKEFETILPKNFNELKSICMEEFNLTSDDFIKLFNITYIDEEGEYIILENDDDYFQAINYSDTYSGLKLQFKIIEKIDGNQTVTTFDDQIKSEPILYKNNLKKENMINYEELIKKEKEIEEKIKNLEEEKKKINEQNKNLENEKQKFEEERIKYNNNIEEYKNKYNKDIESYVNKLNEVTKRMKD